MRAPVTGAVLCAIAAVALLVAGFTPWFSSGKEIDSRMAYERRRAEIMLDTFDDERRDETDVRANFGLVTGEVCIDLDCKSAKYTGAPGLADDAFAWLGRGALGAAMASVVLLIATALAARTQRRTHLRGWAASVAAVAAGLGAAFAAAWSLEAVVGYVSRGMGLTAAILGAAFAGLGVAWPTGRGDLAPAKRYTLAAALALLTILPWISLVEHAWWRSGGAIDALRVSPLGVQVCEAGSCKLATALGVTTPMRSLAVLTSLTTAALLVPAFGTAARIARGVRPGAWGWSTIILATIGLASGITTWLLYPSSDIMRVAWGLPLFALSTLGAIGLSIAGIAIVQTSDTEAAEQPIHRHEPAFVANPNAIAVAPGERPQLAPLAAPPAGGTPVATTGGDASSRYAPPAAVAAAAYAAATGRTYMPAAATATAVEPASVTEPVVVNVAHAEPELEPEPAPAPGPGPSPWSAPAALRDAPSAPSAIPIVTRAQPTAPTAPARKASPICPTCRVATLYSSKRGAWWCSTCKRTL